MATGSSVPDPERTVKAVRGYEKYYNLGLIDLERQPAAGIEDLRHPDLLDDLRKEYQQRIILDFTGREELLEPHLVNKLRRLFMDWLANQGFNTVVVYNAGPYGKANAYSREPVPFREEDIVVDDSGSAMGYQGALKITVRYINGRNSELKDSIAAFLWLNDVDPDCAGKMSENEQNSSDSITYTIFRSDPKRDPQKETDERVQAFLKEGRLAFPEEKDWAEDL
jgi:hypothetical protein